MSDKRSRSERRVLFYSPDPDAAERGALAIRSVGVEPVVVQDEAEVQGADPGAYDAVVLTLGPEDGEGEAWTALLDRCEAASPGSKLVLLISDGAERYVEWMAHRAAVNHIQALRGDAQDGAELRITLAKLFGHDIFGLDRYVPWGVHPYRVQVEDSRDKASYVREVAALAERFSVAPRFVELVETVTDELCTNAIFNAPRDVGGEGRYAHLNRRDPVALEPREVAELRYGCDGDTLAVAVRDPFGALSRETVVRYLVRCLTQGPAELITVTGGAGLGLYRVYRAISQLVVNIRPGVATEMIGLIDLRCSIKEFKSRPKSLHIFVEEDDS